MGCIPTRTLIESVSVKSSSYSFIRPVASALAPSVKALLPGGHELNAGCREGRLKEGLGVMDQPGVSLDFNAYIPLLQEFNNVKILEQFHAHILVIGLEQNVFLGTKLVGLYAMCGSLENARLVFDKTDEPNGFLWNAMIRGYAKIGFSEEALTLYFQMQRAGIQPDSFTFSFALKACAGLSALQEGKEIHYHIVRSGYDSNVFVGTALIDMYAKCGRIEVARQLFDKMSTRNVVSWSAMIAGYAQSGYCNEALALFYQMQMEDVTPNSITMVSVLSACAHLAAMPQGKGIHAYIIRCGFESDVNVGNALTDMYAKCGRLEDAYKLFDKMSNKDVVSWSALIARYAQNGHANDALAFFYQMRLADVKPDYVTMASVLPACAHLADLQQGKAIHAYIIKNGFESDVSVGNALIDMYAKCGRLDDARQVFDKMSKRDVVSWNTIIAGYSQKGHANEALTVFGQMQLEDVASNSVTMMSLLPTGTDSAALQQGKCVHGYIIRRGFESDVAVGTALLAMYAKCGNIEDAFQSFEIMAKRDVVSWNAMVAVCTQDGHAHEALTLFHQMQLADVTPDSVTMVSVLPACGHLAVLEQGKWIHSYIIRNGFEFNVSVANSLVSMYAKCGRVEIARHVFDKMCKRDVVSWNAMIAGYGMHGRGDEALSLFAQMQQTDMKPDDHTFISVMSACSHAGLVDEGWHYFECMSRDYYITPRVEHYACMVDLLARAGHLGEAQDFVKKMPLEPDANVWGALLAACRIHCDIELGKYVSERLLELEPKNSGNYVLLSNMYAAAGRWDDVQKVRTMLKDKGLKKNPGYSWIEFKNRVHAFLAGDKSHPQSQKIYAMLESLVGQMKEAGYVPDKSFVLHDVEEEEKDYILCSHSEKLAIAFGLINTSPGTRIQITKNLRVCGDCHSAIKLISKIVRREIIVRDANRFHIFNHGLCSCRDYW